MSPRRRRDRPNDATLQILHVFESTHVENRNKVKDFRTWEEVEATQKYGERVKEEIEKNYAEVLLSRMDYEIKVVAGFPFEEILKWTKASQPDLIVLGPHSARAEEKGVVRMAGKIGSTVQQVISRERCPVMIVNQELPAGMGVFKRILVGIDYSVSCECALSFATKIAQEYGSKIVIFHMIPIPPYPKYSKESYEADLESSKKRLMEFCDDYLFGIEHEYHICGGVAPHGEILKCADEKDIDLIVMGSHTKAPSGKWYAGSSVERVSYSSKCGVMVVTDPEVIEPWVEGMEREIEKEKDRLIHIFTNKTKSGKSHNMPI